MEKISREFHVSSRQVHDLAAGLRGLSRIAAFALENQRSAELVCYELEVLSSMLADQATRVLEPLEFGKRMKSGAAVSEGGSHD
jgi:hypothetical protein